MRETVAVPLHVITVLRPQQGFPALAAATASRRKDSRYHLVNRPTWLL